MVILLTLVFLILSYFFVSYNRKYEGNFSTMYIFCLCAFVYFVGIPLEVYLKGKDFFLIDDRFFVKMGNFEQVSIILMAILSILGFFIALRISNFLIHNIKKDIVDNISQRKEHKLINSVWFFVIFCIILILTFYNQQFIAMLNSYAGSYSTRYNYPVLSILITLLSLGLGMLIVANLKRKNISGCLIGCSLFFVSVTFGVLLSYKMFVLPSIIGLVSGILWNKKFKTIVIFFGSLFGVAFLLFIIELFSVYRFGIPMSLYCIKLALSFTSFSHIDAGGPLKSISFYLNYGKPFEMGAQYFDAIWQLIPKVIYSGRPLDPAESFARIVFASEWTPGNGLGFSPLAEAYLNFGFIGGFLQFFIFGLIWSGVWIMIRRYFFDKANDFYKIFHQILGFYCLTISFRTPFTSMPKFLLMQLIPFLLFFLIVTKVDFLKYSGKQFKN